MKVMTNTVGYSCTDLNKMTVTFLLMTTDCLLILLTFTPHVKRDLFCYTKWTCAAQERKIFTCRKRSRAPLNLYPSTRAAMTLFFLSFIWNNVYLWIKKLSNYPIKKMGESERSMEKSF